MSSYYVWDAAREVADLYELDNDYRTKEVTIIKLQTAVKATAIVHTLCGRHGYGSGNVVSPGEWAKAVDDAKRTEAQHRQEIDIEAAIPIIWDARKES